MNKKLIIALTGGIGCGKSTVANLFAELDIDIIDADEIARELVQPGSASLLEIKNYFGDIIISASGELDREKLRELIFNDLEKKHWLENLLHPLIFAKIQHEAEKSQSLYCIAVIPLLFETQSPINFDRILVIDSPQSLQIQRAIARDKITKAAILKIIAAQVPRFIRLKNADIVIENDGTIFKLRRQVKIFHNNLKKAIDNS